MAIVGVSLVLCAVFVPAAVIPGLTGQFFKQFAVTIAVSTVISAFNSLTLSPALCPLLLAEPPRAARTGSTRLLHYLLGWWLFRGFNWTFERGTKLYGRVGRLADPPRGRRARRLRRAAGADVPRVPHGARRVHPAAGPGLPGREPGAAARRVGRADRRGDEARWPTRASRPTAWRTRCRSAGTRSSPARTSRTTAASTSRSKPFEERKGRHADAILRDLNAKFADDPRRHGDRVRRPADPRAGQRRRVQDADPGPRQPRAGDARRDDLGAGRARRARTRPRASRRRSARSGRTTRRCS